MSEAIAVVTGDLRAVGTHELAPDESCRPCRDLRLLGSERLYCAPRWKTLLRRAPLEHLALGLVELVEARREQRSQLSAAPRPPRSPGTLARHLRDEQQVTARGTGDAPAQLPGRRLRSACRRAPAAVAPTVALLASRRVLDELQARHAGAGDGRAGGESALSIRRDPGTSRRPGRCRRRCRPAAYSSNSFGMPRRSRPPLVATSDSPRSERRAAAATRSERHRGQLFHHLHHQPVRDPLPIRQAASSSTMSLDGGERLRHQPRHRHAASPTTVTSSHRECAFTRSHASAIWPAPTRGQRTAPWLRSRRIQYREEPVRAPPGSDFPFRSAAPPVCATTPLVHECMRVIRRSVPHRAPPPAPAVPRPFTASPRRQPLLRPGHHLPGVGAHPACHPHSGNAASASPLPPDTRASRRPRAPKVCRHRHHRITDELLHRAAVRLDDRPHPLEVPI